MLERTTFCALANHILCSNAPHFFSMHLKKRQFASDPSRSSLPWRRHELAASPPPPPPLGDTYTELLFLFCPPTLAEPPAPTESFFWREFCLRGILGGCSPAPRVVHMWTRSKGLLSVTAKRQPANAEAFSYSCIRR
jgi:hypothetical protein